MDQEEQKDEDLLLWAVIQDVLQDDKPLHAWERRRIRLMELTPPSCLTQYVPQSSLYCKVLIITPPWSSSWGPTTSTSSCTTSGSRTRPTFFYSTLKSSAWLSHIMNSLQDHDIPPDECGSRSEGRGASWRNPILSLVFTAFGADQAPLRSGTAQDHRVSRSQRFHWGICLWHCYHRWFWYWILSVSKNVTNRVTGSFGNPATPG